MHPREVAAWSPAGSIGVTILAMIAGQGVALGAMELLGGRDGVNAVSAAGLVLADLAFVGVVVAFARRGEQRIGAATLGLRRTAFGLALAWGLLAYFVMVAASALWALATGVDESSASSSGGGVPLAEETTLIIALAFTAIAITAPIVEEIVFRGYLFAALTRWRGPWPAAIITGVLFGAAHFAVYPPELWPPLMVLGFFLCLVFWVTGSLLPCIAMHAANNALAFSLIVGWTWQIPVAVLGAVLLALLVVAPFSRVRAPQAQQAQQAQFA